MMSPVRNSRTLIGVSLGLLLIFAVPASAHDSLHEQIVAISKKIKRSPKDPTLYLKRAELYRLHGEWKNAESDFLAVERLDPGVSAVDLGRGKLWLDSRRFFKARMSLERYLSKQPDSFEGVITMARVLAKSGEAERSARYFTRAIKHSPNDSTEIYLERAELFAAIGKIDEALEGLDEGIEKLGSIVTLQMAALDLEVKRGRYDRAIGRLDEVAGSMPRKESFLLQRGEILLQAGKPCDARASLLEAQTGFDTLPPTRKNVRAVKEKMDRLRRLLDKPSVRAC